MKKIQNPKSKFQTNSKFKILNSKISKLLPGIKKNVLLKNYTTFKIGGPAKYFFMTNKKEDLLKAVITAKKFQLPFFILGGGSNLLVADKGYEGLVIKIKNEKLKIKNYNRKLKSVEADSGALLSRIVALALRNGLTGLEWAVGIPGTVGGAIYGNAGAFGRSMRNITKTVTVLKIKNQKSKVKTLKNKECNFKYRESIFKKKKNLIILSTILQLKKGNKKEIKERMTKFLSYRKEAQPLDLPSAGSIFKNQKLKIKNKKLFKKYPELKNFYRKDEIPAGWLIEKCDLKEKRIGNVKISEKHANFIVNLGNGKAEDVKKLINLIKNKVKNKFGVRLGEEIQFLGF